MPNPNKLDRRPCCNFQTFKSNCFNNNENNRNTNYNLMIKRENNNLSPWLTNANSNEPSNNNHSLRLHASCHTTSIRPYELQNVHEFRYRRPRRQPEDESQVNTNKPQMSHRKINLSSLKNTSTFNNHNNNNNALLFLYSTYILLLFILLSFLLPIESSTTNPYYQNTLSPTTTQHNSKNSGQFYISQLCSPKSPFPVTRRVEGATLSSTAMDTDTNCTITFRTKSAQQHFVIRFEELKLGCDDHLVLFDGDLDYGQPSIKDFSCRDNMASVPIIKTTGTFLTMRYSSDGISKMGDGFKLVVTAVFDISMSDCPPEYAFCRSQLCISRSLFCDGVNHCLDNSDEIGCNGPDDAIELPYALGFFVILILVISIGVITCIVLHCRRDNPYAQYQHQLQRAFGVPLQTSSSLMFAQQHLNHHHHQPQYQFFQPSPYVTPQHHAQLIATLPRGYSTLPLNLVRQQANHQQHPQTILAKPNMNMPLNINGEYLMMTGLPPSSTPMAVVASSGNMQAAAAAQTTMFQNNNSNMTSSNLPNSQSILSTATGTRYAHAGQRDRGSGGGSTATGGGAN